MKEIVNLQFGQRANYLATHFWNLQESYFTYATNTEPSIVDHDIHFRSGIGTDGSETYTPRTVIYDLKGGFGSLKRVNALYDDIGDSQVQGLWSRGTVTHRQEPITQTKYQQDLDQGLPTNQLKAGDVRYWSDFNRVYFHPRSIVQLNEYSLGSSLMPFESWSVGEELFRDVDREADLLDRDVRSFAEEADQMQGFQIFAGTDDAWGGWTERYIDALRDEFGKKSIWVWGLEDGRREERAKMLARSANAARSLSGISKLASAVMRLSTEARPLPGYVDLGTGSEWERTALLAAAVESVTLPTRLRAGTSFRQGSMPQFEQILNTNEGQNVFELGLKVEMEELGNQNGNGQAVQQNRNGVDRDADDEAATFDINFAPSATSLLPQTLATVGRSRPQRHVFAQVATDRHPKRTSSRHTPTPHLDHEELLRRRYNEEAIIDRFSIPLAFPQLDTTPASMFKAPSKSPSSKEWSLASGLTTSSLTKHGIFELRDVVTRHSRAIAIDEREELYNGLTEVGDKYAFGWESEDNSEDE